jgi:hypothetical protein
MFQKCLVLGLLISLALLSGCTQSPPPSPPPQETITTPIPTPVPSSEEITTTTTVPVTTVLVTTVIPTATVAGVNEIPTAKADPVDVSEIQFKRYSDGDFSLDYPSTWSVVKSTYTAYFCKATETTKCYQAEVKNIGPFYFSEYSNLKKPARIVTFTSPDSKQKVVAFISDFTDSKSGNFVLDSTLEWAQYQVTANYPDVPGSAVGDYQYATTGNTMFSRYTVTLPEGSLAYPLAYSMKDFVTTHHDYEFAFISDRENIQKYHNLNERIFSTITPIDT